MKSQILKTVFMTSCEHCVGPHLSGKAVPLAPIALCLLYAEPGWSFRWTSTSAVSAVSRLLHC